MAYAEFKVNSDGYAVYQNQYYSIIPDDVTTLKEKNWAPFIYNDSVYMVQNVHPLHIVAINAKENDHEHIYAKTISKDLFSFKWKYGPMRAFFHSVKDIGSRFETYFIGAYTFTSYPPFRMLNISIAPIIDEMMYTGPWYEFARVRVDYVPYPTGLYASKTDDVSQTILHLSFGLNDIHGYVCSIKLNSLLESMVPVNGDY
eukprot:gene10307-13853_t